MSLDKATADLNRAGPMSPFRQPLWRLLAINLGVGMTAAILLLCGLLTLDLYGLRELIVRDRSPFIPLALLLFGFIITFGSVAMGSAIMAIGEDDRSGGGRRQPAPDRQRFSLEGRADLT